MLTFALEFQKNVLPSVKHFISKINFNIFED